MEVIVVSWAIQLQFNSVQIINRFSFQGKTTYLSFELTKVISNGEAIREPAGGSYHIINAIGCIVGFCKRFLLIIVATVHKGVTKYVQSRNMLSLWFYQKGETEEEEWEVERRCCHPSSSLRMEFVFSGWHKNEKKRWAFYRVVLETQLQEVGFNHSDVPRCRMGANFSSIKLFEPWKSSDGRLMSSNFFYEFIGNFSDNLFIFIYE